MSETNLELKIKAVNGGRVPTWAGVGDAGLDLHCNIEFNLSYGSVRVIPLGITTQFHPDYVCLLRDRSGLATCGLHVLGGVIDSNYRGEWAAIVTNLSKKVLHFERYDRICQAIFTLRFQLSVIDLTDDVTDNLSLTSRSSKGFGSSGQD